MKRVKPVVGELWTKSMFVALLRRLTSLPISGHQPSAELERIRSSSSTCRKRNSALDITLYIFNNTEKVYSNDRFKIAVLPGDGIGPEVIEQALRVLKVATASASDAEISIQSYDFGGIAIDNHGVPLPDDTLKACKEAHAILMGELIP